MRSYSHHAPVMAVVTGAGSGIGRAVAMELSREPITVLAVGRRLQPLRETAALAPGPGEVISVSADVSSAAGQAEILARLPAEARLAYLVHAAGIFPKAIAVEITLESWREVLSTNLDARLFLTQSLIPSLRGGGRVLFVGSQSATTARRGGMAYCTSMAASFMLQACLSLELVEEGIHVANAIPGPVNTAIIQNSMAADPAVFPDRAVYAGLKQEGKLIEPSVVGRFYHWLLTATSDDAYRAADWSILDERHHAAWLGPGGLYGAS